MWDGFMKTVKRVLFWMMMTIFLCAASFGSFFFYVNGFFTANVSEEGWRMGTADPYSKHGLYYFWREVTGEGSLQMGYNSQTWTSSTGEHNPWIFSSTTKLRDDVKDLIGKPIILHYTTVRFGLPFYGETNHRVDVISKLDTNVPTACQVDRDKGNKSNGDRVGYLTSVSIEGTTAKTYEMIMQIGNSFTEMSALDESIYVCAQNFLKYGKKVRVTYTQTYGFSRNPFSRNTEYIILKIELAE